jgi:hypothetical protein
VDFLSCSQTANTIEDASYKEVLGNFFRFTTIPLLCGSDLGKKVSLTIRSSRCGRRWGSPDSGGPVAVAGRGQAEGDPGASTGSLVAGVGAGTPAASAAGGAGRWRSLRLGVRRGSAESGATRDDFSFCGV